MNTGAKPQETELKLAIQTRNDAAMIIRKLREQGYSVSRPVNIRNDDLYLDSYDWSLMKNKTSLRYRLENDRAIYTLKSIGDFKKGIAQRDELEVVLDKAPKAPQEIPVPQIRAQVIPLISARKLMELATIRTLRREYSIITPGGAKVSLAFDSSAFSRERQPSIHLRRRSYEMEAELKEGPGTELVALQKLFSETFSYTPSTQSKLQHAIQLLNLVPLTRKVKKELTLHLDDSVEIALNKIIATEFLWFQQQLPGVSDDIDPEFVHQARVTTRRMRSAVKVFGQALTPGNAIFLSAELKWIAALFGAVRDIDVYIINLGDLENKIDYFPGRVAYALETGIKEQRRRPLKQLFDSMTSPRFKKLERRIKMFINKQLVPPVAVTATKTIRQFAPEVIERDFQAVMARGQEVMANPDMKLFHLLRIEMKRLRYAAEFMAPAYSGALSGFIQRTVEIQDCLGELQDTVFTKSFSQRLAKKLDKKSEHSDIAFVLGQIYQYQANIAEERRKEFADIWSRFASVETSNLFSKAFQEGKISS